MKKKYELTNKTLEWKGHILHRIKALKDFCNVKAGELGGWVESENNLSQYGVCWVNDDAKVYGSAKVYGKAWVYDYAEVYDEAKVYDEAVVYDHAWVCANARVFGCARVFDYAEVCGHAMVFECAEVCGSAKVFDFAWVHGYKKVCGDNINPKNNSTMKRQYKVSIDITMSKNIYVDAENEEEAKQIAIEDVKENSYHYAGSADSFVNCSVTNIVNEDENIRKWLISQLKIKSDGTNSDLDIMVNKAIDYLEKQGGKSVK